MKQTAVEWLEKEMQKTYIFNQDDFNMFKQAKEMEKQQQLELIQFLADRKDFKEHSSMSIFIAEYYLNQFKNK